MTLRCGVAALPLAVLLLANTGAGPTDADLQPEIGRLAAPPAELPASLRLVSYNVHRGDNLPQLIEALRAHPELSRADVFLLQEIESHEAEGASRARRLAEALHLNYVYAPARLKPDGATHGLAILSRFPLADIEVLPLKQFNLRYNTRRRIALGATVQVGERRLRLYNLHLDTRLNTADRLAQLRPVVEAACARPVQAVVIGGDFNTNAFRWLLHVVPIFRSNQAGAVDELMQANGFDTPFTDAGHTLRKRLLRLRLDSLYPRGLAVEGSGIDPQVEASDHAPLWLDVSWPTAAAAE